MHTSPYPDGNDKWMASPLLLYDLWPSQANSQYPPLQGSLPEQTFLLEFIGVLPRQHRASPLVRSHPVPVFQRTSIDRSRLHYLNRNYPFKFSVWNQQDKRAH